MQRYHLDFEWKGFELHPEIPVGGARVSDMFGAARVSAFNARLQSVASEMGLSFAPTRDHAPNTKAALALSEFARRQGRLDAWREAAMNGHWRDERDLEDPGVLRELAEMAGLDPDAALAFLERPEVPRLLHEQRMEAYRWGVSGIPTWFMLPDGWAPGDPRPPEGEPRPVRVVGCQPLEVVERAAQLAGARPRSSALSADEP